LPWISFSLALMRDMKGGEEEEEYFADCADEEDNNEEDADAVATIVGVQVARSKPRDKERERVCIQEDPILADGLCRLLQFWLP
jgi:hypothetical protein